MKKSLLPTQRHGNPKPHLRTRKLSPTGKSAYADGNSTAFTPNDNMPSPDQAFQGGNLGVQSPALGDTGA